MKTDTKHPQESGDRRQMMEWMVGRYPDLSQEEIAETVRYLTKEASAADVGILASNERIYPQYRRLTADYLLDRPGTFAWSITGLLCVIILAAFTFAMVSP